MAKDPAFLFYPQRWLEGTAEFTSAEKGVYIDLLSHQHQKSSLPSDTKRLCRLTGLSESEFLPIWEGIKSKFVKDSVDRLVNRTLTEITKERSSKSETNQITGKLASLIRSVNDLPQESIDYIKQGFKIEDYLPFDKESSTKRLTEWFYIRLKSIININRDIIKDSKEGVGGKKGFNTKPIYSDYNGLPEIKTGAVIQLLKITKQVDASQLEVDGLWNVFKIQNLNGIKYYQDEDAIYSHFINWAKTQRLDKTKGQNKSNINSWM